MTREEFFVILCGIGFIFGLVVGGVFAFYQIRKDGYDGVIEVNTSAPDKDKYLFVFTAPVDEIPHKHRVIFKVEKVKGD